MEDSKIHIGEKISEVLAQQHKTKKELGETIGMSTSASTYLTTRKSVDVETLWKISLALKFDFFKHYPVEEEEETSNEVQMKGGNENAGESADEMKKLKEELEKYRREMQLQKVEIQYLKKINELLERK